MNIKKYLSRILLAFLVMISFTGCASSDTVTTEDTETVETSNTTSSSEDNINVSRSMDQLTDDTSLMIEESDYISKIKLITKNESNTEIKVLDNIKGTITSSELPTLDLKENRAYIVFLKNDGDGIVLVDGDSPIVLLEGDNHELFEKINKYVHR